MKRNLTEIKEVFTHSDVLVHKHQQKGRFYWSPSGENTCIFLFFHDILVRLKTKSISCFITH